MIHYHAASHLERPSSALLLLLLRLGLAAFDMDQ